MPEIVTLQLGHSSSFVGTHLWNALDIDGEHVDSSVMIRSGIDAERGTMTYAPRLVVVDLKGSLGTLKRVNQLYEDSEDQEHLAWNGKIDVRRQDAYAKNEYLTFLETEEEEGDAAAKPSPQAPKPAKQFSKVLDSSVQVWSDFNSMFYHPRTVVELGAYAHGDSVAPFAIFNQGCDLWTEDRALQEDILENRIRFFLEECDSPQGIQVLADISNAFSGFASSCLESLREDVGKMCITVYGVSDNYDGVTEPIKNFNEALALSHITEFASLYVPIKKPSESNYRSADFGGYGLKSTLHSRYHWSACLAAAIDTITLPTRLAKAPVSMPSLIASLSATGPLAMLSSSVPFPFKASKDVHHLLAKEYANGNHVNWLHNSTFDASHDLIEQCEGQVSVLRGVPGSPELTDVMNTFLSMSRTPIGRSNSFLCDSGFPISLAYPDIFNSNEISASAPVFAQLKSSSRLSQLVSGGIDSLQNVPGKVVRMMEANNISREFIASNVDDLTALLGVYEELA
ncbi:Protein misato 1 [Chytriomyces hyalinus]|nr:Protein misato 1 [Chytriomyces hyalinus]